MGYAPLLFTMFTFIFALNIWEIVPFAQMPVNARIALPLLLTGHLEMSQQERGCTGRAPSSEP